MTKWKGSFKFSFFILCFGAFLDWMSFGIVYPIFSMLVFRSDSIFFSSGSDALRGFWLGALMAASPLGQFFSASFLGALSDQIGRKITLQGTYFIIILGYFLSAYGILDHNFSFLIFGRLITGIGAGNISVINSSVADISLPHKKTGNFALITMASGIGFTVGPVLGGKLSTWGFDVPFIFSGFLTFCSFLFFTFLFTETYPKKEKNWIHFTSRLHSIFKIPSLHKFRMFFPAFFIFCFGWSFYWEFISGTWIKIYKLDIPKIGNFYAYGSAFYVLSSGFLIRPIIKKFHPINILIIAWGMLGFCSLLLLNTPISWYWFYIPIQQFLVALVFPLGMAVVSNAVTKKQQGETLGSFQSLQSFAFSITPFLGGILLDLSYNTPLIVSCTAMFLACFLLFIGFLSRVK